MNGRTWVTGIKQIDRDNKIAGNLNWYHIKLFLQQIQIEFTYYVDVTLYCYMSDKYPVVFLCDISWRL